MGFHSEADLKPNKVLKPKRVSVATIDLIENAIKREKESAQVALELEKTKNLTLVKSASQRIHKRDRRPSNSQPIYFSSVRHREERNSELSRARPAIHRTTRSRPETIDLPSSNCRKNDSGVKK